MGQIKTKVNGKDRTIGIKVRAQIVKNRMGPPLRAADFDIFFERGIDNYGSWLGVMKENKIVKQRCRRGMNMLILRLEKYSSFNQKILFH